MLYNNNHCTFLSLPNLHFTQGYRDSSTDGSYASCRRRASDGHANHRASDWYASRHAYRRTDHEHAHRPSTAVATVGRHPEGHGSDASFDSFTTPKHGRRRRDQCHVRRSLVLYDSPCSSSYSS